MAIIKVTSPQAVGSVKLKVTGRPKLILVNGHWNRLLNLVNMSPGEDSENYWIYFLGGGNILKEFIENAQKYFKDNNYQDKPFYVDGSSLLGGDQSGNDRKIKGYKFAMQHIAAITKGVGNEKFYFISHSEGAAYAAGMAKALIEKGYKVGESVMLSADEGDEFTVEGNYPCYQITAGYIEEEEYLLSYISPIHPSTIKKPKRKFHIDPIVGDHRIQGVNRYGVYISFNTKFETVHGSTIDVQIFNILKRLKKLKVIPQKLKGKTVYMIADGNIIWHKIDNTVVVNKNIDIY
ncbi:hypothetical protein J5A68_00485 [Prevotella melaninogenica]|uniref:Alpha/beta hydrolase n=1 Tax=Prevotella melaninogenica TaxID=28132 RepID=A0A7D4G0T6_9BACT|nr:hypothetical protein [Prevotella melaninogenica]EFC72547.1 hypothetical protein HMPREF0660_01931 [Prevotella melaninogenica D18]QKH89489.1 hypothetical protein FIU21_11405 [Prevotella melaninogenica]QUB68233.1 hypothetical protein J5A68_00485 [Prevotella melaninogenica]